jgi:two-component system cell cycle sensor histidine kinase/response regulator CckA
MNLSPYISRVSLKGKDYPLGQSDHRTTSAGAVPGKRPLILLVEDEDVVRRTVARMLEMDGFNVVEVEHGLAARDLLVSSPLVPDLVLTDLRMPFLNGAELGEVITKIRPGLPVLYMSGFGTETQGWLSPEVLDSCYIAKPFSREQLLETVRRCLKQGSAPTHH